MEMPQGRVDSNDDNIFEVIQKRLEKENLDSHFEIFAKQSDEKGTKEQFRPILEDSNEVKSFDEEDEAMSKKEQSVKNKLEFLKTSFYVKNRELENVDKALKQGFLVLVTKTQTKSIQIVAFSALSIKQDVNVPNETLAFFDDAIQNGFTVVLSSESLNNIRVPDRSDEVTVSTQQTTIVSPRCDASFTNHFKDLEQYNKNVLQTIQKLKESSCLTSEKHRNIDCSIDCSSDDDISFSNEPDQDTRKDTDSTDYDFLNKPAGHIDDLEVGNDTFDGTITFFNEYYERLRKTHPLEGDLKGVGLSKNR